MRVIKFRAYYIPEKTWFNWEDIMREFSNYDKPFEETTDWKVMQYTGFKDKNGKDIYEDDIITVGVGHVEWCSGVNEWLGQGAGWIVNVRGDYETWTELEHSVASNNEVIGNIYENKEL